jgi:3',5'-cyclic AMP phosphodiesterase CpdA
VPATRFLLAHLSDPHLAPLPRPAMRDLASKRVLGYLNWRRGRDEIHRGDVLLALMDDLAKFSPDHVAVTGDLTNLALDAEFAAAAAWLERLGTPETVTVIPGNHDAYVRGALERGLKVWAPYLSDEREAARRPLADLFPTVRRRDSVAIVGVSTAIATGPFMATGRVGGRQLIKLADDLVGLSREGFFRVVLLHHPLFVTRRHWAKRLLDAGAVRTVLAAAGAELVLHGHMHQPALTTILGPRSPIPIVGVPSASADPVRAHHPAGYALYDISESAEGWSLTVERRGFVAPGTIDRLEQETFTIGRSRA